jgi:predicted NACHT family NTPase
VRVILREFVARSLQQAEGEVSSDTLWHFIVSEMPDTLQDFAPDLLAELQNDGSLLLLDGLDEVPEADHRREQIKTVVEEFAAVFPRVVILVTSRTYAYQPQDWKLRDFAEATLEPFGRTQIRNFIERWYDYVGQVRSLSDEEARGRATLLNRTIESNQRLHELATRPLLLTLMASLHAWRGGTLGCFPDGASPYGMEELSGNVREWTRSLEGNYPYPADTAGRAEREDLQVRDNRPRVWRGASFIFDARYIRCAVRFGSGAQLVNGNLGFRVVVAVLP